MSKKLVIKLCGCGATPEIKPGWIYVDFPFKVTPGFQVRCPECTAQTDIRGTKNAAIRDWNHERIFNQPVKTHIMSVIHKLKKQVKLVEMKKDWRIK
jgi:hypothetical protein